MSTLRKIHLKKKVNLLSTIRMTHYIIINGFVNITCCKIGTNILRKIRPKRFFFKKKIYSNEITHYFIIIGTINWKQTLPKLNRKYPSTLTVRFVDNLVNELSIIKRKYPSTITVLFGENLNNQWIE